MNNNIKNNINIHEILRQFGLENNEIDLYIKLLEKGDLSLSKLSREAKIPKTTTYDNISKLMEKGIVSKISRQGRTYLHAESVDTLELFLNVENKKLESKLKQNRALCGKIPSLEKTQSGSTSRADDSAGHRFGRADGVVFPAVFVRLACVHRAAARAL